MIKFKKLTETSRIPERADLGSAGYDLFADLHTPDCIDDDKTHIENYIYLMPGQIKLVPTNIAMSMPNNLEGQIRSRSGLSLKHGVIVLNSPGTIDSSYRGSIGVIMTNVSETPYKIHHGDKIAQLIFNEIVLPEIEVVDTLDETSRGEGGFGSSGR